MTTSILDFRPELNLNTLPICPHCHREQSEPWELELDDGKSTDTDCQFCEKPFVVVCEVSITYSTREIEPEDEWL